MAPLNQLLSLGTSDWLEIQDADHRSKSGTLHNYGD
jgi:hypothetical protein